MFDPGYGIFMLALVPVTVGFQCMSLGTSVGILLFVVFEYLSIIFCCRDRAISGRVRSRDVGDDIFSSTRVELFSIIVTFVGEGH